MSNIDSAHEENKNHIQCYLKKLKFVEKLVAGFQTKGRINDIKMIGKGFSACLLCDNEEDLLLGNQLALKIIKFRYKTDIFDVMLQNTKICIKCIGRLQQLNDFCSQNDITSPKYEDDEENDKKICDMCRLAYSTYEIIPPNKSIADDIELTKWLKNCEEECMEVTSCFSCYNFMLLYNDIKEQLTQLLDYFYAALNNCKVKIKDCGQNADQYEDLTNIAQEQFFGSLSLTPVPGSNRSRRSRVTFASDVEIFIESSRGLGATRENSSLVSQPMASMETESCEPSILVDNEVPAKSITRNLRNSTGSTSQVVPVLRKARISRHSTGSSTNPSNLEEALKKQYNIIECSVFLTRLPIPFEEVDSDVKKNKIKASPKKTPIKIKISAKSKVLKRQMKRSLRTKKNKKQKKKANDENSINLEVVMAESNLNNSQSSTISIDPLDASPSKDQTQNDSSSFSLDEILPIMNPEHSNNAVVENNNNKVFYKENNDVSEVRSTRKTRNSAGKLTESTNVPENKRLANKRKANAHLVPRKPTKQQKKSIISPKKELEDLQPESIENVDLNDYYDGCDEYLSSAEESEANLEESYLTEIEFLHPQYKNKGTK